MHFKSVRRVRKKTLLSMQLALKLSSSGVKKQKPLYMIKAPGFALIEVLIAATILSIIIVSLFSGVSTGALAIAQNKNMTSAILIARSKLNEFKNENMKGTDISGKMVEEFPGFTYDREILPYENELLPSLVQANVVTITVHWNYNNRKRNFSLDYIYIK